MSRRDGTRVDQPGGGGVGAVVAYTMRHSPGLSAGVALAIAASVALGLLPPLVLQRVVDDLASALAGGPLPNLPALATAYVALSLASGMAQSAREAAITALGERLTHAMRSCMEAKLRRLPAEYFSRHGAGELTSLLVADVNTLEDLFSSGVLSLVADACSLVGVLAIVFAQVPGLGLVLLVALPAIAGFTRHVQRRTRQAQAARRAAVAQANQALPDTLRCFRMVRTLGVEGHMLERYGSIVQRGFDAMEESNFYDSVYSPVVITTGAAVTALSVGLATLGGTWATLFGMTAGTAVAMIQYVGQVFTPISDIGMEIQVIQSAGAGLDRIRRFLAEEEMAEAPAEGPAEEEAASTDGRATGTKALRPPALEVCGASFAYEPGPPVLDGASLVVEPGEVVTIEGRTGSGKSTLFGLALGLYAPDAGAVRLAGRDPARLAPQERRRLVGYVAQSLFAVEGSVADNVALRDPRVTPAQVARVLSLVGLADAVASLPQGANTPLGQAALSQGQLQLLAIARAVVLDPQLLLLDETTANLDSATERTVMEALLSASRGRTVVSISHRTSDFLGGRRVRLEGGRLVGP